MQKEGDMDIPQFCEPRGPPCMLQLAALTRTEVINMSRGARRRPYSLSFHSLTLAGPVTSSVLFLLDWAISHSFPFKILYFITFTSRKFTYFVFQSTAQVEYRFQQVT